MFQILNVKNKSSCNLDRQGIAWKCILNWIESKNLNSIVVHRDVNLMSYIRVRIYSPHPKIKATNKNFFFVYLGFEYCKNLTYDIMYKWGEFIWWDENEGMKEWDKGGNVCTILSKIIPTPFPKITGTWKCSLSFINSTCVTNALCVSKHLMIKWVDLISFFAKNTFNRWINGYKIKSNLGSNSQNYNCLM